MLRSPLLRAAAASRLTTTQRAATRVTTRQASLTKLVATIGPASEEAEPLQKCVNAGMHVMRLNFSHATPEEFFLRVNNLAASEGGDYVAKLLDTRGPEVRLGGLAICKETDNRKAKVLLEQGNELKLTTDPQYDGAGDAQTMYVNYERIAAKVKVGDQVLLDDGLVTLDVVATDGATTVTTKIANTNEIGERKGVNLPGVALDLPALSAKDEKDVAFGIENGIDVVAASFVRDGAGVDAIRSFIDKEVAKHPSVYPDGDTVHICSKIESLDALQNIDDIIEKSDGIMVARGDLGVEVPLAQIATWQKTVVAKCREAGKPVVVATQMLESMQKNPRPTRAEVADVTNAALDLADAVMLSGESANGDYPDLAIRTQQDILEAAEAWDDELYEPDLDELSPEYALARACVEAQRVSDADSIVVIDTERGDMTRRVAALAPDVPVIALVESMRVGRQLNMSRGVAPQCVDDLGLSSDAAAQYASGTIVVYRAGGVSLHEKP